MDDRWLSNAYLVADEPGGAAVFVDSGAPVESLLRAAEEWRVTPAYILRTHSHADHVAHEADLELPVARGSIEVGKLVIEAVPTPGHSDDMVCFVVDDEVAFSGDTLFKDAVGGVIQLSGLYPPASAWTSTDPSALSSRSRVDSGRYAVSRPV